MHRSILPLAFVVVTSIVSLPAQGPDASAAAGDDAVRPFAIAVPDAVLRDLDERLARTRFPDEVEGAGWAFGADMGYMRELVAYWRDTFDWRAQELALNRFDQFTTTIDDLSVHFIHQRSPHPDALPIVITQGYPSSISEFVKVIGPLSDPVRYGGRAEDAFHIVTISLPGIGFTERPQVLANLQTRDAEIIAALMERLGYERYAVQGGDIGAFIGRRLALTHPDRVVGLHLNYCASPPPPGDPTEGVPEWELERMRARQAVFENEHTGWLAIQQRKPQTLGFALSDSPVGLAAWLADKWRSLCDCDDGLDARITKDEVLTNVMIYWVSETSTSSMRRYAAGRVASQIRGTQTSQVPDDRRVEVPTACAVFPKEADLSPRRWVEARYNITRWTEMPRGGHFPPLEEPDLYVEDIRAFFRDLR